MLNKEHQIYLEIALIINKRLYNNKTIDYYTQKLAENVILKKLKEIK